MESFDQLEQRRAISQKLNGTGLRVTFFLAATINRAVTYVTKSVLKLSPREWHILLDMPVEMARSVITQLLRTEYVNQRQFHFFLTALVRTKYTLPY